MVLRTLPEVFKQHGYTLTQLDRTDRAGLYEVSYTTSLKANIVWGYEVVKIRKSLLRPDSVGDKPFTDQGFTEIERYPSLNEFGRSGWAIRDKHEAMNKFVELNKEGRDNGSE